ncbi:MAG TPA: M2 family metallopeptidase [Candidatus Krumholzibacteriaceae bacterium]|nr:M2 family metallopeptidase [Candidatus Krumholzibacteriaceae bacterium]
MNFREFVVEHENVIKPLKKKIALAHWNGSITGAKRYFDDLSRLRFHLEEVYAAREDFTFVERVRASGDFENRLLSRIGDILYLRYLGRQTDLSFLAGITKLSSGLERKFNLFRAEFNGMKLSRNDVSDILLTERNSRKRQLVWESHKRVGELIEEDLIRLVELRNEAAAMAGFDNFYSMSLYLNEQDEGNLVELFDRLERVTREPFRAVKDELDGRTAQLYGITEDQVMPWHYEDLYFQELPGLFSMNFDKYYSGTMPAEIAAEFYDSIGMNVSDILVRSDLYEREGKSPHAFCTDIDRAGDIRVLCNIKDNAKWTDTILHELGHAVYDKYVSGSLPYLLRIYPNICLTEASAIFFGGLARDPLWMKSALDLSVKEVEKISSKAGRAIRARLLVFARWCQVMFRFERELYRNPRGDLNAIWWNIVREYQFITPPPRRDMPDWATKIHIVTSPVYYHNYMLGELIAAQFRNYIENNIIDGTSGKKGSIYGNKDVSQFFIDSVYSSGNRISSNELIENATGEPLKVDYLMSYLREEKS